MVGKKLIAIIPARGGSKRIPRKNIVDFMGKPLIAWTIKAARESGLFDRILVSTDDKEIASVTEDLGLEVPFLRDTCYDDITPVSGATIAALRQTEQILGEQYDVVVQLMANCPLRKSKHILDAYNHFQTNNTSFQISCFRFGWMNPWWAVKLDEQAHPSPLFPGVGQKRSQDLDDLYCPTGAIWIAKVPALIEAGSFYGPSHTFCVMDWMGAVDIDDDDDLRMAKAVSLMEDAI